MAATTLGGQRAVVEAAHELRAAGQPFALALVVEAEGSTYRKPGALALVTEDGRRVGVISGGCLEQGLVTLARKALDAAQPRDGVFDTNSDDDVIFGSGSGCRGRMRVVAFPVTPGAPAPLLEAVLAVHESRHAVTLAVDTLAPNLPPAPDVRLEPPPLLMLIGAGPEAAPLVTLARTLGWYTWLADHREGLLENPRLALADRVIAARPAEALAAVAGDDIDAALIMTHTLEGDLAALRALAAREVAYVGLLGPKVRRDELLMQLTVEQRAALEGRLHAPVGLKLGGEGPEAIVVGIVAELHRSFHGLP